MKRYGFALLALLIGVVSCTVPLLDNQSPRLQDVSYQTDFRHLRSMAYMGGSVYYNPDDLNGSPVVVGAKIAFRLGRADRTAVDASNVVFRDRPQDAKYGLLEIVAVDGQRLSFRYDLYDREGQPVAHGTVQLALDEVRDLDGDGTSDINYTRVKTSRPGFESATYLNFLSSQISQTTSMFSVIPSQYAQGQYPNGVMGVNSDGRFLVTKYQGRSTARALVSGLINGDFVLDSQTGKYERVISVTSGRSARALEDSDLASLEAPVTISFLYHQDEFRGSFVATALWKAIPTAVTDLGPRQTDEASAVVALNRLLARSDFISTLSSIQAGPVPAEALPELLSSIPTLTADQLVQLNRLYLEKSYPALSPQFSQLENPVSEVLPLMACDIGNSDAEAPKETRVARAVGTANSPAAYDLQRATIEQRWSRFQSILTFDLGPGGYKINNIINDFLISDQPKQILNAIDIISSSLLTMVTSVFKGSPPPQPQTQPNESMVVYPVGSDGKIPASALDLQGSTAVKPFKTTSDGKIPTWESLAAKYTNPAQTWKMSLGLYGTFSSTWGNLDGGLAFALFMQADSKFLVSGSYTANMKGAGSVSATQPIAIPLRVGSLPPVIIGVVSICVSLDAGFEFPVEMKYNMDMSMGIRMAFTGLYGGEAHAGVNYGVRWSTMRVGWWDVSYPSGGYADMYGNANWINDTAFYLGPSDFVLAQSPVAWVDSARASVAITPSVYLEPRVSFNSILWFGLKGKLGNKVELGVTAQQAPNTGGGLSLPAVHASISSEPKVSLEATYGASVTIPVLNWGWNPSGSVPLWNSTFPAYETTIF